MSVNQQSMKWSIPRTNSRKYLLFSILFVLLTFFPHSSDEFSMPFGVGGGGGDGKGKDAASSSKQALMSKFKTEKKFKFHKIERLNLDDDVNASGDNDVGEEDDEEIDDDAASRQQQNENSAAADSSRANEDEEIQFERAHKAHKETRKQKATKQNNEKVSSTSKEKQSKSIFSSLFGGWFGGEGGEGGDNKKSKHTSAERDQSAESTEKSNGIIDWLKWMGEKTRLKSPPPVVEPEPVAENWLSYLNRWPFNTLFPIGKPAKPIRMPRRGRSANANSNGVGDNDDDDGAPYEMSQEHFESLLHTLPGFVANSSHVANIECRQQLQIFYRQLRGNKLWPLQMLDATGKITSGLLRGNINQFGDFDLCTQVKTKVKVTSEIPVRIRGKYCLAHIEMQTSVPELKVPLHLVHGRGLWNSHLENPSHFAPRYAVANWGICIPNMCSGEVVQQMIETNLRPYNTTGVEFHVEVDDDDCYMRQTTKFIKLLKKDGKFAITIFYISSLVLLTLITLIYEHWTIIKEFLQKKLKRSDSTNNEIEAEPTEENATATNEKTTDIEENNQEASPATAEEQVNLETSTVPSLKALLVEVFKSFSPKRSLSDLLSQDRSDMEFPVLHALKLLATFMIYICLKYLMIGHLPISNRDKLVRTMDNPLSVVFRAPMIYTDILLLISGFLSAYQLSEEMEQKTYIQLLKRMASKIARCLPTVYVVLFFQTFILPHLGSGPLWTNLIGQNARICEQQMWRNVFSVQNAIDFEETCSPMTIQLALDVQLYLLGPLIVWLYYTDADAAFFAYGAIHAMSVAARYSRTQREHLSMTFFHGMNVSKFYRTANILYSSPISRATPYLLGIGAGLFQRSQMGTFEIAPELLPVGWGIATISILWCFWSPSAGMRSDYIYSSSDAASYAAWSPLILGLALIWIIFMFPKSSENSVLKIFTSSRPIVFMSRIAFPMQLVMYVVVVYNTASVKETRKYHMTDLINCNEIAIILFFAVLIALLIDIPSQNIRRLLVNRIFIERPHSTEGEQEPVSGAEQSEAEDHSEHERISSDTPEPGDGIWASDPEEEEHKYLERRRSSTTIVKEEEEEEETEETETSTSETTEKEQDDEEETEIDEEAEIKKRPDTPPPPSPTPAPGPKEEDEKPTYRRRRRPTSDD